MFALQFEINRNIHSIAQRKHTENNTSKKIDIKPTDGTFPAALTFHWLHMDAMDSPRRHKECAAALSSHALSALLSDRDRLPPFVPLSLSLCRMMMGMGTKVTAKIEKDHSIAIIAPRTSRLLLDFVLSLESERK